MAQGVEAGLAALDGFGGELRAALLSDAAATDVIAQVADVSAGLAGIAAEAEGQGRQDAAERFDALRKALSCVAAHLARGDRRAAFDALEAGSFPGALAALKAHLAPEDEISPPEAEAAA